MKPVISFGIAVLVMLTTLFAGFEPKLLITFFLVFALFAVLSFDRASLTRLSKVLRTRSFIPFLVFAGYVILSGYWSAFPMIPIIMGALSFLLATTVFSSKTLFQQMSSLQLYRCARAIVYGLPFALLYIVFEYLSDFVILNYFLESFPELVNKGGKLTSIPNYYLNANVATCVLLIWPAWYIASIWENRMRAAYATIALLVLLLPILYMTESATAQVAFVLGFLAYCLAQIAPRFIAPVAKIGWIFLVVGVIPTIFAINATGIHKSNALPYSFRDRIHIWNYTANQVIKNPLLGIGVRSDRKSQATVSVKKRPKKPKVLVDHKGWHSHNIYLQTWYELGAVGALLLFILGFPILRAIEMQARSVQPFLYASLASFGVISAIGFGAWQSWLLATYSWCAIFFIIGIAYATSDRARQNR